MSTDKNQKSCRCPTCGSEIALRGDVDELSAKEKARVRAINAMFDMLEETTLPQHGDRLFDRVKLLTPGIARMYPAKKGGR